MEKTIIIAYSESEKKILSRQIKLSNGKIGLENWKIEHHKWEDKYDNLTLIQSQQRNFILSQSNDNIVSIKQINNDGTISLNDSYSKKWNSHYSNLCCYTINNQSYICMQNSYKQFFIQKVNNDGTLGNTTYNADWSLYYSTMGCMKINDKHFLYAQNSDEKIFFIRELTSDGKLSEEGNSYKKAFGNFYSTMGSIEVSGKVYLYGQKDDTDSFINEYNKFFIQEVDDKGILQETTTSTKFNHFYNSIKSIVIDGRSYIVAVSEKKGRFFIQEVLPGGKLAKSSIYLEDDKMFKCNNLVIASSNQFLFGHNWMDEVYKSLSPVKKKSMTLKDYCMPASHDAGMYKINKGVWPYVQREMTKYTNWIPYIDFFAQLNIELLINNSLKPIINPKIKTQELNTLEQLRKGVRYFDFRPGISPKVTNNKDFYLIHGKLPSTDVPIPGEKLADALDQINSFITENSKETIILYFSHFKIGKDLSQDFIDLINLKLGNKLLSRNTIDNHFEPSNLYKSINNLPIQKLQGKVIVLVHEDEDFDFSTLKGSNLYKGMYFSKKNTTKADTAYQDKEVLFTTYDDYANSSSFDKMREDQLEKFAQFGQTNGKKNNEDALFAVDWTLTMQNPVNPFKKGLIDNTLEEYIKFIHDFTNSPDFTNFLNKSKNINEFKESFLKDYEIFTWDNLKTAKKVNSALFIDEVSKELTLPNPQGRMVNFLSVDSIPNGIVDFCIKVMKGNNKI